MAAMGSDFPKYFVLLVIFTLSLGYSKAELFITHSPQHTQFLQNAGSLDLSELSKVVVSSFGFGLKTDLKWSGMAQENPFRKPKAHCIVSVEGLQDGSINPENIATYQVNNDIGAVNTDLVTHKLRSLARKGSFVVDFSQYSRIYDVRNEYPDILKDVPASFSNIRAVFTQGHGDMDFRSLNISQEADLGFLGEILMLKSVINALKSHPKVAEDARPDFIHFKVTTMSQLIQEYGQKSEKVKDALQMLKEVIDELTSDLRGLYKDNVVVQVVTFSESPEGLHRNVRSLLQQDQEETPATRTIEKIINVAPRFKDNYAVYFNIILWLVVVLILTVLFVSYGIWFMDPGRDSIIYRMTSQRLKRE